MRCLGMSRALAANNVPTLLPGVVRAGALVATLSVVGGIAGAAITSKRRRVWQYTGIGAGVTLGLGLGWVGGHFLMKSALAKFEAQVQAAEDEAAKRSEGVQA